ncbi:MAG: aspartate kinase [Bacteroidetes bacterium]|nr:aspartate kinase [Bacteroidota bacterium]
MNQTPLSESPRWEVHKFGGAAVKDAWGFQNAAALMNQRGNVQRLVVVSAIGKSTSALEQVVREAWEGRRAAALAALEPVLAAHQRIASELGLTDDRETQAGLEREFNAMALAIEEVPGPDFDRFYDRIVHRGEVLSSVLAAGAFRKAGLAVRWHDSRQMIHTDNTHREARVDWALTEMQIREQLPFAQAAVHVVQGFIGSGEDGHPVTLGLEGSDFTAAIFAKALQAASVTLWKNVAGVFSADPAHFPDAERLPQLSYLEVFQMANYGAKVIHPKTMGPLESAGIPLLVRSFLDPSEPGTDIGTQDPAGGYPPIRVRLEGLLLISLHLSDLSYLGERHVAHVFSVFRRFRTKAYLTEIGLMNLSVAVAVEPERQAGLLQVLGEMFRVKYNENLFLLTVRHDREHAASHWIGTGALYLEQRNRQTMQCLYKAGQ